MLWQLCLTTLLSAATTQAAKPLGKEVCVASCYYALLQARFAGPTPRAQRACANALRVRSTYYCLALHCRDDEAAVEAGLRWWAASCKNSSRVVNPAAYRAAVGRAELRDIASRPPSSPAQLAGGALLQRPVVPDPRGWRVVYQSAKTFSDLHDYHDAIRLQSIVIASYMILQVAICATHYPILEENY
ncbi:hypothetical protein E4U53_003312 [Claviceps sorghi]|nr:hypothetical protein E4U53_003312 [Claviceps sorghi]